MTLFAVATPDVWPLLPVLVFVAEICVVTLSTIRIIFLSRGMKFYAALLGFFEVSIWLFAIGQIMQNLSDVGCYLAFAAGFTLGNYCGVLIENKLALGTVMLRTITRRSVLGLVERLTDAGYGVTTIAGHGATGPVKIVLTVIKRKELASAVALVREFDAQAFYWVDEIEQAESGIFPTPAGRARLGLRSLMRVVAPARQVDVPV